MPKSVREFDLEYFEEAAEVLCNFSEIIPDRYGVIASCFAGQLGLCMGIWLEKCKAVISCNGFSIPFETTTYYKGKSVVLPPVKSTPDTMTLDENHIAHPKYEVWKKWYSVDDENCKLIDGTNATNDTHFLLLSGGECGIFSYVGQKEFKKKMNRAGKKNVEQITYPGAAHILDPPYNSLSRYVWEGHWYYSDMPGAPPYRGLVVDWGGTVEGTCKGAEQMWPKILSFFNQHIKDESEWYQKFMQSSKL